MSYASITVRERKKFLSSNFELRSEFREASRESLVLTGTPSVRNLKFRMRLHCAGNPSHCKRLRVLRRFSVFACLCWNSQRDGSKQWITAMLTRDYRECSRYSRSSVGTPKLKMSNKFIDALTYAGDPLIVLAASFENVLKIRYNDARLR